MGLLPLHLIQGQQKMLDLVAQRQEALSDNIANMHTVGYKRKDVDFSQYLSSTSSSNFEAKLVDKYGSSPVLSNSYAGKNISTEDELTKMQQNYLIYSVATRQLSSTITQIKTAMNVSANG